MATRKKTTTKKTAKATVKRSVAKKNTKNGFWKIEPGINAVYWIVIGIAVISTALFSYNTYLKVNDIYDQVDFTNAQSE